MSLFDRIRSFFGGEPPAPPPALRNRPGGMAWVRGIPTDFGGHVLNGAAVKTVRLNEVGTWTIDPPLFFVATSDAVTASGTFVIGGMPTQVLGIEDCFLEPWKDIGDEERSEEMQFQPTVPAGERQEVAA